MDTIKRDVVIVGAGASGLMAYNLLTSQRVSCALIEITDKMARKIYATGNGRCNITNKKITKNDYFPVENRTFADNIFKIFSTNNTVEAFHNLGVECLSQGDLFYPINKRAEDVAYALTHNVLDNDIYYNSYVTNISGEDILEITTNNNIFNAKYLIAATGLNASEFAVDNLFVKDLSKQYYLQFNKPTPALAPMQISDSDTEIIKNARNVCKSILYVDDNPVVSDVGEVQFIENGLSGITMFNLSTFASRALSENRKVHVDIDFLFFIKDEDIEQYAIRRYNFFKDQKAKILLNSIVDKRITRWIFTKYGLDEEKFVKDYNIEIIVRMFKNLKKYTYDILAVKDFKKAQSSVGGIDPLEFNNTTLSLNKKNNIYVVGEAIDITGRCGGFNLQFAWSSAFVATLDILKRLNIIND